jgi:hypothetical protein
VQSRTTSNPPLVLAIAQSLSSGAVPAPNAMPGQSVSGAPAVSRFSGMP